MPERLWVCHPCQMIGTEAEATAHRIARGHEVAELPQDVSDALYESRNNDQAQRVGALIAAHRSGVLPLPSNQQPEGAKDE
jgi:hypothetical protein